MAFFPNYNSYGYPYQQAVPQMQAYQNSGNTNPVQAPQTQVIVRVPSYDVAKTFPAEPGKPITFFDDNIPFCYVKTGGMSPAEPPKTRIFELVERSEEYLMRGKEPVQPANNGNISNVSENNMDLSLYAKSADVDALREEMNGITVLVNKMRFDIDALGDKSTKKMVQKARKDADEE